MFDEDADTLSPIEFGFEYVRHGLGARLAIR